MYGQCVQFTYFCVDLFLTFSHIFDFFLIFLVILISNLDIFKGAETIAGEEESHESRHRGHGPRVKVGKGFVVAENCHIFIIMII